MGVIYNVTCKDCKVTRDLDKFYTSNKITTRKEALDLGERIKNTGYYRAGLLSSFMNEHSGHDCTMWNDLQDDMAEKYDPFLNSDFKEDTDFWKE